MVAPDVLETPHLLKLIGVISGYRTENIPVNVNGQAAAYASIAANSGIIIVVLFNG